MKQCPSCGARYEDAAKFCQHDGTLLRVTGEGSEEDPYVGQVLIGQFEIKEVIGEGGMGRVYRGHQHGFDRPVAIKILHTDLVANPEMVKRFNREAKIISRLDHPSIIHVYLFGELPDGNLYLAMEYVDGQRLTQLINEGVTEVSKTVHIGRQILGALTEAHRKGVVHRDLKPDNIMLVEHPDDPMTVKVLDFGIAKFLGSRTMLTQQGLVFGSARYISPEAAAGETVDSRADLYAVGVILYQMFAGRPPFDDSSAVTLLMRHVNDAPPLLQEQPSASHVPEPIAQVVMQALEKDPAHRFDGAAAMRTALTEAARASGVALPGEEPVAPLSSAVPSGWSTTPTVQEVKRGKDFETDPMFGGASGSKKPPPTLVEDKGGVDLAAVLAKGGSEPSPRQEHPSKEVTQPQTPSGRPAPDPATVVESTPASSEPSGSTNVGARDSFETPLPAVDPNDDEIELPRSRAWIVLVVIFVLALAGVGMGALIATQSEDDSGSTTAPDAGDEIGEPPTVAAGLNAQNEPPAAPDASAQEAGATLTPPAPPTTPPSTKVQTGDAGARPTKRSPATTKVATTPAKRTDDPGGMPPAASLDVEPRRPAVGQQVRLTAKISPPTTLASPRFVISSREGAPQWRDAKGGEGGTYSITHSFDKVGTYQVTFVAKSLHGEVRAFGDVVVSARRSQSSPTKTPTKTPTKSNDLRPVPVEIRPAKTDSDNKPPDHEDPPTLLEPWSTPW